MNRITVLTAFVLALAAQVRPAQADIEATELDRLAADAQAQVVAWRRWFHQHPELGNREFDTATRIAEILREMGLEPKTGIAYTGLTAVIEGGRPGPLVAIRTDMDALPVTEETGLPFASTAKGEYNGQEVGVMHACGHDTHTHGARPWNGVDPIVVAAQIVLGLQTIASRQVDVTLAPSIISVGRISGGVRNNVIPDSVELEGTIRTFDPEMRAAIHAAMERTAKNIAASAGAEATFVIDEGYPPVFNDADLVARMRPTLERIAPVNDLTPQTVAEDFSLYAEQTPGMFVFLGNTPPGIDPTTQPSNHSPLFDIYEPSMEIGVRVFSHLVVDYLQRN